jgi:hypothetical protein
MAISLSNCGEPRMTARSPEVMRIGPLWPSAMRTASCRSALRLADLALEAAHARLARVMRDNGAHCLNVDLDLTGLQAVCFQLPFHKIAPRDL